MWIAYAISSLVPVAGFCLLDYMDDNFLDLPIVLLMLILTYLTFISCIESFKNKGLIK